MNSLARIAALAGCAALLAACSIGQPPPEVTSYMIEPPRPPAATASARRPDALRMGNVRVAAAFVGQALVFRMSDVKYVAAPYRQFVAPPGEMLGNRMAEWLDVVGPFASVAQPESTRPARYVLDATVTELYGDFRPGQKPAAVMSVQFALLDTAGPRAKVVLERTLGRRIELPEATGEALVRGYGTALAEILAELVAAMK